MSGSAWGMKRLARGGRREAGEPPARRSNITRRCTPRVRFGDRIYVVERIEIDPVAPLAAANQRPNFYEPQSVPSAGGTP